MSKQGEPLNGVYPLTDADGRVPLPPSPAFQRFVDGVPHEWYTVDQISAAFHPGDAVEQDFGWALDQLRHGMRVCRAGWNGNGMWLEIQDPDEYSKMTRQYIFMSTAQGDLVPWLASQTDMLAFDWELAAIVSPFAGLLAGSNPSTFEEV